MDTRAVFCVCSRVPTPTQPRRFPPPWRLLVHPACFEVQDATGFTIVRVYFKDRPVVGTGPLELTSDEARRIAVNIARLPELLGKAASPRR